MKSYHVGIAAEAAAAAIFTRTGCDVLVQYGANQPEYDLAVSRVGKLLKVSVKGSQDGRWGLTQSFLAKADYHEAIDKWLVKHGAATVFCFVQFKGAPLHEMPRLYLATPAEIARRLRETAKGRGDMILYERKVWFTSERLDEILAAA